MHMLGAYLLLAICLVHQSHLLTQEDLHEVAAGPISEILVASKSQAEWFERAAAESSSIS